EELLGMIVGEDDPEIGLQRAQILADLGRDLTHVLDDLLVLGLRHGEELGRMGQHGAADHARHHGFFSLADRLPAGHLRRKYRAIEGPTRQTAATLHSGKGTKYVPASNSAGAFPRQTDQEAQWSRCR